MVNKWVNLLLWQTWSVSHPRWVKFGTASIPACFEKWKKKKFGGEIFRSVRFPRTFKVTVPPGPIFVFTEIYRNCCCCCNQKTTQCTVGIQTYLIISYQKRLQIDRTHVKTVFTLANGFATRNLKSLFLLWRCTFK